MHMRLFCPGLPYLDCTNAVQMRMRLWAERSDASGDGNPNLPVWLTLPWCSNEGAAAEGKIHRVDPKIASGPTILTENRYKSLRL